MVLFHNKWNRMQMAPHTMSLVNDGHALVESKPQHKQDVFVDTLWCYLLCVDFDQSIHKTKLQSLWNVFELLRGKLSWQEQRKKCFFEYF